MSIRPNLFATMGYVLLWLTPFSLLKNMQIFSAAVVVALLMRWFGLHVFTSGSRSDYRIIATQFNIKAYLFIIMLYTVFGSLVSMIELVPSGEVDVFSISWRLLSQQGALVVYFITIFCGYEMASSFDVKYIRKAIYAPILMMVSICIYQVFADRFGYPYIGNYVYDKFVGLRPSGLAGEPKFLASYFAVAIFFLFQDFRNRASVLSSAITLTALICSAYFFITAASGNGFLSFAVLTLIIFIRLKFWQKFLFVACMGLGLTWFTRQLESDDTGLRGSHQDLFENIGNIDLTLFDDLIALPLMAWRDNLSNLLLGFGPGLMHFFGSRYMAYATWLTEETYIEGNLSAITYASNFGLILFAFLFLYFSWECLKILKRFSNTDASSSHAFFVFCFFVGALIQGNSSIPFFLSLGWILKTGLLPSSNAAPQSSIKASND